MAGIDAFNAFMMVFYNLYDIGFGCYFGVLEGYELLLAYGNFVQNPEILLTNFVYNFGLMYASVKEAALFFMGEPRPQYNTPYKVGYQLG